MGVRILLVSRVHERNLPNALVHARVLKASPLMCNCKGFILYLSETKVLVVLSGTSIPSAIC